MPDGTHNLDTASPRTTTASVLIIGDEVLGGEVTDLNGPFILSLLAARGVRVLGLHVLPDELPALEAFLRDASLRADIVLVTGGIGPTHDDVTRLAVARALDRPLVPHPEATQRLDALFHRGSTPEERAMALLPQDAELLIAPGLVAFGFQVANVLVFPGVPRLLEPLLVTHQARLGERAAHRRELRTGLREGVIAGPLSLLAADWPELRWGSYPELTGDGWSLRLVVRGQDPDQLDTAFGMLEEMIARLGSNT